MKNTIKLTLPHDLAVEDIPHVFGYKRRQVERITPELAEHRRREGTGPTPRFPALVVTYTRCTHPNPFRGLFQGVGAPVPSMVETTGCQSCRLVLDPDWLAGTHLGPVPGRISSPDAS